MVAASPVAIAEVAAEGRAFPALTQPQVLAALRHALGPSSVAGNTADGDGACAGRGAGGGEQEGPPAAGATGRGGRRPARPLRPVPTDAAGWAGGAGAEGLDGWIAEVLADAPAGRAEQGVRSSALERLHAHAARPFAYPHHDLLLDMGALRRGGGAAQRPVGGPRR